MEELSKIYMHRDNLSDSVFPGHGNFLSIVTPYILCIPRKNKRKKTPDTSIVRKYRIK